MGREHRPEYEDFTAETAGSAETKTERKDCEYIETAEPAENQIERKNNELSKIENPASKPRPS